MAPPHPGKLIKYDYLEPLGITISELAKTLDITRPMLSSIINGRAAISPLMALKLAKAFDTTPDLWLGLQASYDLYIASQKFDSNRIQRLHTVSH